MSDHRVSQSLLVGVLLSRRVQFFEDHSPSCPTTCLKTSGNEPVRFHTGVPTTLGVRRTTIQSLYHTSKRHRYLVAYYKSQEHQPRQTSGRSYTGSLHLPVPVTNHPAPGVRRHSTGILEPQHQPEKNLEVQRERDSQPSTDLENFPARGWFG